MTELVMVWYFYAALVVPDPAVSQIVVGPFADQEICAATSKGVEQWKAGHQVRWRTTGCWSAPMAVVRTEKGSVRMR